MNTMTLETLTLQQIVRFANSGDLDVAQFGHRVLRLMTLAVEDNPRGVDYSFMRNLDEALRKDLANDSFVALLVEEIYGSIEIVPVSSL